MSRSPRQFYEFGPFCLDISERQLSQEGKLIALTPKAYQTLLVLVRTAVRLLRRNI